MRPERLQDCLGAGFFWTMSQALLFHTRKRSSQILSRLGCLTQKSERLQHLGGHAAGLEPRSGMTVGGPASVLAAPAWARS